MLQQSKHETAPIELEEHLRRRAEQAERRLTELLSGMPEGYVAIDRDWKITFANRQAALISRKRPDEFVGRNVWEVWPGTLGTELERRYRQVMETRVAAHFEHYVREDETWFELSALPTGDGIGVYFLDTTQQRRAETALEDSERHYRAFTELNPQLILMADASGQVTYANQRLLKYSGLTLEQIRGEGWGAAVHPEDKARVLRVWADALARDVDFELETRIRRGSDGAYLWFWVRGLPVRDEANKTLYWLGACIEIQEHKSTVQELEKSRQETEHQKLELESLYRTAPIGLALFDPVEFRYLRLNDFQADIVGLPAAEIIGKTVTEIAPIEGLREMFERVAQGEPIRNMLLEGELPTRPGVHRYWTVNYYPVYGPDGTIRAITAASLEITAQKRAELALIQSEKLAAVGRLASSISHEINNPLEAVTNLLYIAQVHRQLPEEVRKYLQTAQEELARVTQISTQALRFHRQTIRPTQVSTADLINSTLNLYRGRLQNSNIQVYARFTANTRIVCFENDIRQVLNNLIANAFDAMRLGGRLMLRTHNATDAKTGNKGVRLTVADSGHGIPMEARRHLFEAFFTTKDLNGTGLGLWIARGIAEQHHGRLTFRSSNRPGRSGTVFTLFLPECANSMPSEQP